MTTAKPEPVRVDDKIKWWKVPSVIGEPQKPPFWYVLSGEEVEIAHYRAAFHGVPT